MISCGYLKTTNDILCGYLKLTNIKSRMELCPTVPSKIMSCLSTKSMLKQWVVRPKQGTQWDALILNMQNKSVCVMKLGTVGLSHI